MLHLYLAFGSAMKELKYIGMPKGVSADSAVLTYC